MDTRENLIYREKVEEIQGAFADAVKSILASHFNYIIKSMVIGKGTLENLKNFLKRNNGGT